MTTPARHRAAAVMLRSRYQAVVAGRVNLEVTPCWGFELWLALAREHDRRAKLLEALADTAELPAIVMNHTTRKSAPLDRAKLPHR